jgi:DNA-binding Lrp family transcriptional regulator
MAIDQKDKKVLALLRMDSRLKLKRMARILQVPQSTLHDRLKKVQHQYVVKHSSLLNFSELGFMTRAIVVIRVEKEKRKEVNTFLMAHPMINTLQKINNGYDFLFEGVFPHLKDMEEFFDMMESLYKIKGKNVYYIIDDMKREGFMEGLESLKLIP